MIKLDLYSQIYDIDNLVFAWRKARKHKTKKIYVKEFEMDLQKNLFKLSEELKNQTYTPEPLKTFVIRDPKTRKISKSHFRDRIIHHALVRIIEPIFEKVFIYDSCACRIGKGNLFALMRFSMFKRKITCNLRKESFCLKCDVKHYFAEVDHKVLLNIISKKIKDNKVIWLIKKILQNGSNFEKTITGIFFKVSIDLTFFSISNPSKLGSIKSKRIISISGSLIFFIASSPVEAVTCSPLLEPPDFNCCSFAIAF